MPGQLQRHPALVYTASRLGLLAVALVLLSLTGLRGALLVAVALLASGVVSIFLLSPQRDAMSAVVAARVERARNRLDEGARAEDDEDDARRAGGEPA